MNIVNTLSKTVDCLFWPLFVYFVGIVIVHFITVKKYRIGFLFVLFILLSWRSLVVLSSSRYCSFFILLAFVSIAVFWGAVSRKWIKYHIVVVAAIISVQSVKCFSGHRDVYIYDIKDEISVLSTQNNSAFLIFKKELKRLSENGNSKTFFAEMLEEEPIILGASSVYEITREKESDGETVGSFFSNKQKTKRVYIRKRDKEKPVVVVTPRESDNLINNGDVEKCFNEKLSGTVNRLVKEGAVFYSSKDIKIPQHRILLPTSYFDGYPEVFADSTNVIDGTYSLNVRIFDEGQIYFFNTFENAPGQLSFYIKNMNGFSSFVLGRLDYESDMRILGLKLQKKIYIFDNNVHYISIPFAHSDYAGPISLFFLKSSNAHFLLDNICYSATK